MHETVSEPLRGKLVAEFSSRFGSAPTSVVRVPGRVNLVGEHIDYNGLPVLPMAIQRNTLLLFRPRSDCVVHIASTERASPPRSFSLESEIEFSPTGDWGNYVKAAAREIVVQYDARRGFDGLVYTTIPIAAGLSSSSALVVATALALLEVNSLNPEPFELMEALASAERHVGTKGGGMDQAVLLGARARSAVQVSFRPLRLEIVRSPLKTIRISASCAFIASSWARWSRFASDVLNNASSLALGYPPPIPVADCGGPGNPAQGSISLSDAQVTALMEAIATNRAYVNVHTTGVGSGEVRGQIVANP